MSQTLDPTVDIIQHSCELKMLYTKAFSNYLALELQKISKQTNCEIIINDGKDSFKKDFNQSELPMIGILRLGFSSQTLTLQLSGKVEQVFELKRKLLMLSTKEEELV